jgi:imidazolonepropionase-like amidohydrolase
MGIGSLTSVQATALFDVFRRNNSWLCPTLTTLFALTGDNSLAEDTRLRYFDGPTRTAWTRVFKSSDLPAIRERYPHAVGIVGAMHKAGVNILAGTDVGEPYCMPGFSLHDELRRFVEAGISPVDALRSATYKPAEFLGLLDSLGTVEAGKLAEMVLLDANPLDDINNTTKINMVFTGGRVYRRPALDSILAAVEAIAQN